MFVLNSQFVFLFVCDMTSVIHNIIAIEEKEDSPIRSTLLHKLNVTLPQISNDLYQHTLIRLLLRYKSIGEMTVKHVRKERDRENSLSNVLYRMKSSEWV